LISTPSNILQYNMWCIQYINVKCKNNIPGPLGAVKETTRTPMVIVILMNIHHAITAMIVEIDIDQRKSFL
jgi:hypothetical protein